MSPTDKLFVLTTDKEKKARDILIESHLGLVRSVAKRYEGRGVAEEDLFQIGVIGLIRAIDRFDRDKGVKFSTYAVPVISGEIKMFFREDGLIRVSRKLKEDGMRVRRFINEYEKRYGIAPTIDVVEEYTDLSQEEILMAFEAGEEIRSIHEEAYEYIQTEDDAEGQAVDKMFIGQLMDMLDEMERKLIIMRYFEEITQEEIARRLSLSQVQVSRMEKRILKRLRMCVI